MLALEKKPKSSRGTAVARPGALDLEDPEAAWHCAVCDLEISGARHAFGMRASGSTQVFPNPLGQMKVIVTVKAATNWVGVGGPTADFTWFDGYTWQVIVCAGCRAHLGWRYEAEVGLEPPTFFGLLADALRRP
jgi:hypothetical protein